MTTTLPTATFDYAVLDAETRIIVQQRTGEIKTLMRQTAQGVFEIGEKLLEVKQRLDHGQFGAWLDKEFGWTDRTARRFMAVAEQFKTDNLSEMNISPSALYLLASPSTPDEARQDALARAAAGQGVTHKAAQEIVRQHNTPIPDIEAAIQQWLTAFDDPIATLQELATGDKVLFDDVAAYIPRPYRKADVAAAAGNLLADRLAPPAPTPSPWAPTPTYATEPDIQHALRDAIAAHRNGADTIAFACAFLEDLKNLRQASACWRHMLAQLPTGVDVRPDDVWPIVDQLIANVHHLQSQAGPAPSNPSDPPNPSDPGPQGEGLDTIIRRWLRDRFPNTGQRRFAITDLTRFNDPRNSQYWNGLARVLPAGARPADVRAAINRVRLQLDTLDNAQARDQASQPPARQAAQPVQITFAEPLPQVKEEPALDWTPPPASPFPLPAAASRPIPDLTLPELRDALLRALLLPVSATNDDILQAVVTIQHALKACQDQ